MPRAREIIADQNSAEFRQLRESFETLLRMIEAAGDAIVAGDNAEDVIQTLGEAVAAGIDNASSPTATNYVVTEREILAVKPTPEVPTRPGQKVGSKTVELS